MHRADFIYPRRPWDIGKNLQYAQETSFLIGFGGSHNYLQVYTPRQGSPIPALIAFATWEVLGRFSANEVSRRQALG